MNHAIHSGESCQCWNELINVMVVWKYYNTHFLIDHYKTRPFNCYLGKILGFKIVTCSLKY